MFFVLLLWGVLSLETPLTQALETGRSLFDWQQKRSAHQIAD
jgi:hypothetical protein